MSRGHKKGIFPKQTYRRSTDMKRCSTSLIIREMQIKTTMKYHFAQSEWLLSKSQQITCAGKDGERDPRALLAGLKLVQPLWKTAWGFFRKL